MVKESFFWAKRVVGDFGRRGGVERKNMGRWALRLMHGGGATKGEDGRSGVWILFGMLYVPRTDRMSPRLFIYYLKSTSPNKLALT